MKVDWEAILSPPLEALEFSGEIKDGFKLFEEALSLLKRRFYYE
ncbi:MULTISPECIES: hypothetical protein [Oscillatoriales]|nr:MULTISPECIES: hypothetical protein [Oscillatoriales]